MTTTAPTLPPGYVVATAVQYPRIMTDRHSGKQYTCSVQLLNTETADIPRGVGMTMDEAFAHAVENIGGDDGLSAEIRRIFQGPPQ